MIIAVVIRNVFLKIDSRIP